MRNKLIIILLLLLSFVSNNTQAYENTIYIWQRLWSSDILDSLNTIHPYCRHFMILTGDFKLKKGRAEFTKSTIDWTYLKDKGDVTIAFRINANLTPVLTKSTETVVKTVKIVLDEAKENRITITGVQIDYDCPTAKLKDFISFVKGVKARMPLVQFSITALPTWLDSVDFRNLIESVDYYVLQLHSFEIPKEQDNAHSIFPGDKATEHFKMALMLKKPFYISLPTYSYEVAYDKNHRFFGLRAEYGADFIGEDINLKLFSADPIIIAHFVKDVSKYNFEYFKGISWFRLPLKSDHYNWDIKTLQRVIVGGVPTSRVFANIAMAEGNVQEIYLLNIGEVNINNEISFDIYWYGKQKPIYDVLGSYTYSLINKGIHVKGRAPMVGKKVLVAWFKGGSTDNIKISNSKVIIDE